MHSYIKIFSLLNHHNSIKRYIFRDLSNITLIIKLLISRRLTYVLITSIVEFPRFVQQQLNFLCLAKFEYFFSPFLTNCVLRKIFEIKRTNRTHFDAFRSKG